MHAVRRGSVNVPEAIGALVNIQRRMQGQRIGFGTIVVLRRNHLDVSMCFEGLIQCHDARGLIAIIITN